MLRRAAVLVLTHSRDRLAELMRVPRRAVSQSRWSSYSFATLEALPPRALEGYVWQSLADGVVRLLYDPPGAAWLGTPAPRRSVQRQDLREDRCGVPR